MLDFLEIVLFVWNLLSTWRFGVPFAISAIIGISVAAGIHDDSKGGTILVVFMVIGFLIGLVWQMTYQKRQAKNAAPSGDRP
jgi:hypothetical protein